MNLLTSKRYLPWRIELYLTLCYSCQVCMFLGNISCKIERLGKKNRGLFRKSSVNQLYLKKFQWEVQNLFHQLPFANYIKRLLKFPIPSIIKPIPPFLVKISHLFHCSHFWTITCPLYEGRVGLGGGGWGLGPWNGKSLNYTLWRKYYEVDLWNVSVWEHLSLNKAEISR